MRERVHGVTAQAYGPRMWPNALQLPDDGDGGEDGSVRLEAGAGAVSEVEGGIDGAGEAAAPAAAIGPKTTKRRRNRHRGSGNRSRRTGGS